MSFFSTAARALRVAREYNDAWEAALAAIEAESSLPDVVRAFAAKTEDKFDDQAAEVLIDGLTQAITAAEAIVHLATVWSPKLAEIGVQALVWELWLTRLRGGR